MSRDMFSVIIASLKVFDESRTHLKQFTPRKPNPHGLKIFVLASSDGQVLDFEFFQGKEDLLLNVQRTGLHLPEWGTLKIGEAAVLRFVKSVSRGTSFFFDRFFTTPKLLEILSSLGMGATGTMRKHCAKQCRLKTENQLKRSGRGSSDCARWCKREKRHLEVERPRVVELYNSKMGGVDIIDQVISCYRSATRSAKFTARAILHLWTSLAQMHEVLNDDNSESEISEEHDDISRKRTRPLPIAAKRTNSACHMPDALPPYSSRMRCRYPGCFIATSVFCLNFYFTCMLEPRWTKFGPKFKGQYL
ncbi:piggyBac transposable element-derived protein 3-like [Penaeus monodon]|uniref:piggyBac transposable element-derived protein 3-like n=1 Tax=Penaeus monodon TaxID=6687 RepID=UPI0018A79DB7|nr:piggyBac transposable element-derived protein 3-like [Penaeus monodon]